MLLEMCHKFGLINENHNVYNLDLFKRCIAVHACCFRPIRPIIGPICQLSFCVFFFGIS